jgi:hypothetical protein
MYVLPGVHGVNGGIGVRALKCVACTRYVLFAKTPTRRKRALGRSDRTHRVLPWREAGKTRRGEALGDAWVEAEVSAWG